MDELIDSLREVNKLQNIKLDYVKKEIKFILDNSIIDNQKIEKTFDELLDLTYWFSEEIEPIYYKLLDYYKNINLEASKDYEKFYLEIIEELNN